MHVTICKYVFHWLRAREHVGEYEYFRNAEVMQDGKGAPESWRSYIEDIH